MKIQKYTNTISPFSGISFVNHFFNKSGLSQLIDKLFILTVILLET